MTGGSERDIPTEAQLLSLAAELGLLTEIVSAGAPPAENKPVADGASPFPEKSFRQLT